MAKAEPESQPTFEEALAQVEAIIDSIEQGKVGLEETLSQCERGAKLLKHCRSILADAEARIQQLQLADNGRLTPVPMDQPPAAE